MGLSDLYLMVEMVSDQYWTVGVAKPNTEIVITKKYCNKERISFKYIHQFLSMEHSMELVDEQTIIHVLILTRNETVNGKYLIFVQTYTAR